MYCSSPFDTYSNPLTYKSIQNQHPPMHLPPNLPLLGKQKEEQKQIKTYLKWRVRKSLHMPLSMYMRNGENREPFIPKAL